jgi:hypothetical protein
MPEEEKNSLELRVEKLEVQVSELKKLLATHLTETSKKEFKKKMKETDYLKWIKEQTKKHNNISVDVVIRELGLSRPWALRYMKMVDKDDNEAYVFCRGNPRNPSELIFIPGDNKYLAICKKILREMLDDPDQDKIKLVGPMFEFYGLTEITHDEKVAIVNWLTQKSLGKLTCIYPKRMDHMSDITQVDKARLIRTGNGAWRGF